MPSEGDGKFKGHPGKLRTSRSSSLPRPSAGVQYIHSPAIIRRNGVDSISSSHSGYLPTDIVSISSDREEKHRDESMPSADRDSSLPQIPRLDVTSYEQTKRKHTKSKNVNESDQKATKDFVEELFKTVGKGTSESRFVTASNAVTWMINSRRASSRKEAVSFGNVLLKKGFIQKKTGGSGDEFLDSPTQSFLKSNLWKSLSKDRPYCESRSKLKTSSVSSLGKTLKQISESKAELRSELTKGNDREMVETTEENRGSDQSGRFRISILNAPNDGHRTSEAGNTLNGDSSTEPKLEGKETSTIVVPTQKHAIEIIFNARRSRPSNRKDAFVAHEAVTYMVESGMARDRQDAVRLCNIMLHKGFIQHATGTRHIFSDEHLLFRATFELPRGQESISEKKKLSGLNSNSIHASKEDDRIHTEAEYMASCSGNNEEDDDPFLRGVIDPNTRRPSNASFTSPGNSMVITTMSRTSTSIPIIAINSINNTGPSAIAMNSDRGTPVPASSTSLRSDIKSPKATEDL